MTLKGTRSVDVENREKTRLSLLGDAGCSPTGIQTLEGTWLKLQLHSCSVKKTNVNIFLMDDREP